jgi:hypothetical protein
MVPFNNKCKYAFALQRNSRTFIESAVEYARQGYPENWKFAVLHLNTALELILKARLALEDYRQLVAGKAAHRFVDAAEAQHVDDQHSVLEVAVDLLTRFFDGLREGKAIGQAG